MKNNTNIMSCPQDKPAMKIKDKKISITRKTCSKIQCAFGKISVIRNMSAGADPREGVSEEDGGYLPPHS